MVANFSLESWQVVCFERRAAQDKNNLKRLKVLAEMKLRRNINMSYCTRFQNKTGLTCQEKATPNTYCKYEFLRGVSYCTLQRDKILGGRLLFTNSGCVAFIVRSYYGETGSETVLYMRARAKHSSIV